MRQERSRPRVLGDLDVADRVRQRRDVNARRVIVDVEDGQRDGRFGRQVRGVSFGGGDDQLDDLIAFIVQRLAQAQLARVSV